MFSRSAEIRAFLAEARPFWTSKDLTTAQSKLSQVGIATKKALAEALANDLNARLMSSGHKKFNEDTIQSLKRCFEGQRTTADGQPARELPARVQPALEQPARVQPAQELPVTERDNASSDDEVRSLSDDCEDDAPSAPKILRNKGPDALVRQYGDQHPKAGAAPHLANKQPNGSKQANGHAINDATAVEQKNSGYFKKNNVAVTRVGVGALQPANRHEQGNAQQSTLALSSEPDESDDTQELYAVAVVSDPTTGLHTMARSARFARDVPGALMRAQRTGWPQSRQGQVKDDARFGRCYVVGTMDDFEGFTEMAWNSRKSQYYLDLQMTDVDESFQILADGTSWEYRFYPSIADANPYRTHSALGPDSGGHGVNWTIGRDPREGLKVGSKFRIVLHCPTGGKLSVTWQATVDAQELNKAGGVAEAYKVNAVASAAAVLSTELEELEDDADKDLSSLDVQAGPPIDLPPWSMENLWAAERKRLNGEVEQELNLYDNDTVFPRPEDEQVSNRDGFEVFVLTEALKQLRQKFESSRIATALFAKPIVIIAFMAVHITKESRLIKLRAALQSIQDQRLGPKEAEFVVGISWYSKPELEAECLKLFSDFTAGRASHASPGEAPLSVIVHQQQRHSQFQHMRAALNAVEGALRKKWSFQKGDEGKRAIWCMFGDDDDIWHPRRVSEFVKAIRSHKKPLGTGIFASVGRAEVKTVFAADEDQTRVLEEDLPGSVAEVDEFIASRKGLYCNREDNRINWMQEYKAAGTGTALLWPPVDLPMEYFDFCCRLRILKEFFEVTAPHIITHRFCDLRFDLFLLTYPWMGREMGLELAWFDPGDCWMYFYSNAGVDPESIAKKVEEDDIQNDGSTDLHCAAGVQASLIGGNDNEHMSSAMPIRRAEQLLADQVFQQLKLFDTALSPARLTKYLASYRIALEINFIRLHTRKIDQRTFDQQVFDCVMNSFGAFAMKVWTRSPDLSSRPAVKLFKVCQSFAKTVAKSFHLSVLWHSDEFILPESLGPFLQQMQADQLAALEEEEEEEIEEIGD